MPLLMAAPFLSKPHLRELFAHLLETQTPWNLSFAVIPPQPGRLFGDPRRHSSHLRQSPASLLGPRRLRSKTYLSIQFCALLPPVHPALFAESGSPSSRRIP